jgi:hypothetical protein
MCETIPFTLPRQSGEEMDTALGNARGSDNSFLKQMLDGYRWELYVLTQLQMRGYWGAIHPLRVRPDRCQAKDYSDPYDLVLGSRPGTSIKESWQVHLDVKARSYPFSEPGDWPFPTVTVDPVGRYERRTNKPDYWAVVSSRSAAIMFISEHDLASHGQDEYLPGHSTYKSAPKEKFISMDAFLERLPEPEISLSKRAKLPSTC